MHSRIKIYNKFQKIEQRVSDDPSSLIYLIQIIFIYARFSCICLAYKDILIAVKTNYVRCLLES